MQVTRTALLLMLAGCGIATQSSAQSYLSPTPERHSYDDRFRFEVDLFRGGYDTHIRLDNVTTVAGNTVIAPGTDVSAENDLGLASSQFLGQVELTLLPGKHHMVRFNALTMNRDAQHVLTSNVKWDNDNYLVGERVDSSMHMSMVGLTYGYLPFRTDRYELGLSFGLQIASVDANAEVRSRVIRSAESAAGPIPLIGIEGRFDFTKRWSVDARWQHLSLSWANIFGADLSGVEASITDSRIALRWRQNQYLLYGIGYRQFKMDVQAPSSNPAGAVMLGLSGPLLFVQASL